MSKVAYAVCPTLATATKSSTLSVTHSMGTVFEVIEELTNELVVKHKFSNDEFYISKLDVVLYDLGSYYLPLEDAIEVVKISIDRFLKGNMPYNFTYETEIVEVAKEVMEDFFANNVFDSDE